MGRGKSVKRRQGNRREAVLAAAARRFFRDGYAAASMRDIAADAGMQASSIYYHFPSKADLLAAVHEEGMHQITDAVTAALEAPGAPWERLQAACVAHLGILLTGGDILQAVMRELPTGRGRARQRVVKLRDDYEAIFAGLLNDLDLPPAVDRHQLRLMLMGSMNWAHNWYRPGADAPEDIARGFVRYLQLGLDAGGRGRG